MSNTAQYLSWVGGAVAAVLAAWAAVKLWVKMFVTKVETDAKTVVTKVEDTVKKL